MEKKKLVILSGAGVSAESGIATFRDSGGLWEGHDVMSVASPQGWAKNKELVLEFYNQRRKQAATVEPNEAHKIIAELEKDFDVTVITQNVDNLHERAGSTNIIHLHGELFKSQSTVDENLVYEMKGWEIKLGDKCEKGSQLRPYIVWFGEAVPLIKTAAEICAEADIFIVIGTSLVVYPAAGLIDYVPKDSPKFIIDPKKPEVLKTKNTVFIEEKGTIGMPKVKEILLGSL
jgi:NAD-dependent deacetylase